MKYASIDLDPKFLNDDAFLKLADFIPIKFAGLQVTNKEVSELDIPNLDIFTRLNLSEFELEPNKIKQLVSSQRYNYDIICIEPKSANLASFAARDRRVDGIRISSKSKLKEFNTRYGRRLDEYKKMVEIDLSFFWSKNIAKELRPIIRILKSWKNCEFSLLLTHQIRDLSDLRSYPGLQSLGRLIGVENSKSSLSNLYDRINQNRKKIRGDIPFEGVEII